MAKKNKLSKSDKITSTSDVTLEDILACVAEEVRDGGEVAETIKNLVKNTVRPCAIGGVPEVVAAGGTGTARFGVAGGANARGSSGSPALRGGVGCGGASAGSGSGSCTGVAGVSCAGCPGTGAAACDDMIRKDTGKAHMPGLAENSEWFNTVLQNGEVWTPYTCRRFLPAQYMHLMVSHSGNVDAAIARCYSLRDCFRILDTEIEKMIFLERHWKVAFVERSKFIPVETCRQIFRQYLECLRANINDRSKCTFSKHDGTFWRRIQGEGKVELWKQTENTRDGADGATSTTVAIDPTQWLSNLNWTIEKKLNSIDRIKDYADALDFLRSMPHISMGTFRDSEGNMRYWLPKVWKEAFKKQGAYYTLKSLVMNRHVRFTTESGDWRKRETVSCATAREGLDKLRELSDPSVPSFVVHAILKKSIEASKFDVAKFLNRVRKH